MQENTLGIIIIALLIFIVLLVGLGDLMLAFLTGINLRMPGRKVEEEADDDIEILRNPIDGGPPSIRVPNHRLPEFFETMMKKAKENTSVQQEKENEVKPPAGYI